MWMTPVSMLKPGMTLANGDVIRAVRHGYWIGITFTDGRTVEVKDDILVSVKATPLVNVS